MKIILKKNMNSSTQLQSYFNSSTLWLNVVFFCEYNFYYNL